jgi:hypothetical protein
MEAFNWLIQADNLVNLCLWNHWYTIFQPWVVKLVGLGASATGSHRGSDLIIYYRDN